MCISPELRPSAQYSSASVLYCLPLHASMSRAYGNCKGLAWWDAAPPLLSKEPCPVLQSLLAYRGHDFFGIGLSNRATNLASLTKKRQFYLGTCSFFTESWTTTLGTLWKVPVGPKSIRSHPSAAVTVDHSLSALMHGQQSCSPSSNLR